MMQSSHKKWGKLASLGAVAVLSFSVLAACGDKADSGKDTGNDTGVTDTGKTDSQTKDTSKVLATYDGGTVTENQFNEEMNVMKFLQPTYASMMDSAEIKNYLLDQQIAYQYLDGKASDAEKKKGAEMAKEQIDQFKTQVGDEQLLSMLEQQNVSEEQLSGYMTKVMTAVQYMSGQVTDEEVQKEYDSNKEAYVTADVRHILIGLTDAEGKERTDAEAKKLADEVKAKLDKGEDFAALAKEYSEDPGSAENGGLYEDQPVSNWVEEFKKATLEQKVGVVGDPVKTEYGYHIIKVEKRNDTLNDEVKESVRSALASTKLNEFMENDLKGITKSKEEFKDEEAPAAEGTDGTSTEGTPADGTSTDGAEVEGTDQGAATDQGTDAPAADESGDAGSDAGTSTDGK
ncbi:peptidylprolyl isomerase [Saccharibacillus sp. CPCC 101409]|uniref:peptidylprolyl isomerase n=1 Tax=Saccharibacillus sp. CPCC 101409 TaxID=3058041 RepID=UPI002672A2A3|nr:peptidylprolyl isomerase [Saccharibacillus sp. CPCC 101409]MDO3412903.1 peptidylprolyl isomerase [Saccharibacillus sp. CPCC 101409]